jgi:hypothetical protein
MPLAEFIASGRACGFSERKRTGIDTEGSDSSRKNEWEEACLGFK